MKKEPNKKLIGLFVVGTVIILLGLIAHGVFEKYSSDTRKLVVLYFSESIKGLSIGSSVVYEGVQVGKVVKIEIETNPKTLEFSIPVYIRFSQDNDFSHMNFANNVTRREFLQLLIKKGLRARLANQNFLTGQLMIELFMDEQAPAIYHVEEGVKSKLEIPTTLSAIGNLTHDIQDLPLKQIIVRFDHILQKMEEQLPQLIEIYTNVGQKVENELPELMESYKQAGNRLNATIQSSVPQTNQTLNQLNQTLKDISAASKSVYNLSDYLERHPDSILKGKKE